MQVYYTQKMKGAKFYESNLVNSQELF